MKENWLEQVKIRLMTEADLPLLEWNGEFQRYRKVYREVYRSFLAGKTFPWIAELDGVGLIGQIFLTWKPANIHYYEGGPYFFISSFRIKPEFQRRGLGSLLLKICEVKARDHTIRKLILNCSQTNRIALSFYEKHGFTKIREDTGIWRFIDDQDQVREEIDPAWVLGKRMNK